MIVREAARRAGKGWPTIFLLALAYAVIEESLICQTLFNPFYFGFNLLREAYIPALGMAHGGRFLCSHCTRSGASPPRLRSSNHSSRLARPSLGSAGPAWC